MTASRASAASDLREKSSVGAVSRAVAPVFRARASREAAWLLVGRVAASLAGFAGVRALTQVMAPDVYGQYALLVGFVGLVMGFAIAPLGQAMNRFAHEALRAEALRSFLVSGVGATTGLAVIGGVAAVPFAWSYLKNVPSWLAVAACIAGILVTSNLRERELTTLNVFRFRSRYVALSTADAWLKVAAICGGVLLVGGVFGAAIGMLVATVVVAAAGIPWVLGAVRQLEGDCPHHAKFDPAAMYRYAAPLFAVNLFSWVMATSDRYVVAALLGDETVGRYVAGYQIASAAPGVITSIFFPTITPILFQQMAANPDRPLKLDRYLVGLTAACVLLIGLVVVDVDAVSRILLSKRQFDTGDAVIPWVSLGLVFLAMQVVVEHQAYLVKRTKGLVLANGVAALANVALNFALARRLGVVAPAMSTCIAYLLLLVLTVAVYRPSVSVGSWWKTAGLLGTGIAMILLTRWIVPLSWPVLARAPARWLAFALAFGAVAWRVAPPREILRRAPEE